MTKKVWVELKKVERPSLKEWERTVKNIRGKWRGKRILKKGKWIFKRIKGNNERKLLL